MNTLQKLFDMSLTHIRKQGKPSRSNGNTGACKYKLGKLGCATAPFIVNYKKGMEGKNWRAVLRHFSDHVLPESIKHVAFVMRLQYCHDEMYAEKSGVDAETVFMWGYETAMERLASTYPEVTYYAPK